MELCIFWLRKQHTYLSVSLQVVVEHIDADGEVPRVEGIGSVPALRSELPALHHHGVEVDEREEDALELILPSTHLQRVLVEGVPGIWYVIVVPWVSRVYGICTLRAVNTYNCTKSTNPYTLETHGTGDLYHNTNPYTLETHGTGDLYHNTITDAVSYDKR